MTSSSETGTTLIILGAGPKAMAIATKRWVLRDMGFRVPNLVVIEEKEVGANWTGRNGFTDGTTPLGTPPEKDLGYPYGRYANYWASESEVDESSFPPVRDGRGVSERMLARFSYQRYLLDHRAYGSFIDAGRPHPPHARWADYLQWVQKQLFPTSESDQASDTTLTIGRVSAISLTPDNRWSIKLDGATEEPVVGDGLVITGPGRPSTSLGKHLPPEHPRFLDGRSFWEPKRFAAFKESVERGFGAKSVGAAPSRQARMRSFPVGIAVVGTGETAASVLVGLQKSIAVPFHISVFCPQGMLYSRGESFWEKRLYSDPDLWLDYDQEERDQFIKRTDRGVLSPAALALLRDSRDRISLLSGKVEGVYELGVDLIVKTRGRRAGDGAANQEGTRHWFDYVIDCTGSNPAWFTGLFKGPKTRSHALLSGDSVDVVKETYRRAVNYDLSVCDRPKLHLPMLAGHRQGPGFPNLSCLGALSDRILASYCFGSLPEEEVL